MNAPSKKIEPAEPAVIGILLMESFLIQRFSPLRFLAEGCHSRVMPVVHIAVSAMLPALCSFKRNRSYRVGLWPLARCVVARAVPLGVLFASGYRNNGSGALTNVSGNGNYWSFAPNSQTNARNLNFNSSNVNPLNTNNRSNGFSVRPCRELK